MIVVLQWIGAILFLATAVGLVVGAFWAWHALWEHLDPTPPYDPDQMVPQVYNVGH